MKINFISVKSVENTYKTQSSNIYSNSKVSNKNDRVEISQTARYLSKISMDSETVDEKKINDIKSKIESGTYSINSKDIAKKMLDVVRGDKK